MELSAIYTSLMTYNDRCDLHNIQYPLLDFRIISPFLKYLHPATPCAPSLLSVLAFAWDSRCVGSKDHQGKYWNAVTSVIFQSSNGYSD